MTPLRVLIVEDNPVIRDLFMLGIDRLETQLHMKPDSLQVFQSEDGASAWEHIVKNGADLVVVDLYLPVLNGLDLIKRIRENKDTAGIKVLAISASIQDARDRSLGAGANQFLPKPLRLVDLLGAMKTLLNLS